MIKYPKNTLKYKNHNHQKKQILNQDPAKMESAIAETNFADQDTDAPKTPKV